MDALTRRGETIAAALTGLAIAAAYLVDPFGEPADVTNVIVLALSAGLVVWIAWQDCVSFTIPDGPLLALGLLAIADRLQDPIIAFEPLLGLVAMGLDVALAGGGILLVREIYYRRRGHDGIGFGDVKLAAVSGLLCGLQGFAWALFSASLLGLAFAFVASRRAAGLPLDRVPFGAFLAPALWGVWVLTR